MYPFGIAINKASDDMKAWLYSAASSGKVRANWSIREKDLSLFIRQGPVDTAQLEHELTELLEQIDHCNRPDTALLVKLYPLMLALAAESDAWQAVGSEDWQRGIQIVVVDSPLPKGHRAFLTFTFPCEEPLSSVQLATLVERVVSGSGGCCAG